MDSPCGMEDGQSKNNPSGCSNSTIPPNRKSFEQRIWQVNNRLAKLQEQMKAYWREEKRTKFGELKEKLDRERREYGLEAEEELHLMEGLRELEARLQGKQREVHEMEMGADLIYKSMPLAKQKLGQLEGQFKERKFTNIRDEQMWVGQMDRMQRNIARLAKYGPLVEQKRMLEAELREKRRREVRQKMRMHKDGAGECRRQIGALQQPFRRLREELAELRAEKRALVERYNAQKDEYRKWVREEKARKAQGGGGGSFPAASLLHQDADSMDLFHSQKAACTRLIAYLDGLKQFGESRIEAREKEREKNEVGTRREEEDSADELPEAFQKHFGLGDGQKGRNKLEEDVRKLAKKQAMPLSHGIDWIRLFGEIEVPPPRTHAEVPCALREVQRVFEFYKVQTAEQEDDEEEGEANGGCPDWAMMSISGYSSSLTSPTALSSSLLSPASFASYSPRLSFGGHPPNNQNRANREEEAEIWTEDEPCSSSAESSVGNGAPK